LAAKAALLATLAKAMTAIVEARRRKVRSGMGIPIIGYGRRSGTALRRGEK
jgi:hypothetical protein